MAGRRKKGSLFDNFDSFFGEGEGSVSEFGRRAGEHMTAFGERADKEMEDFVRERDKRFEEFRGRSSDLLGSAPSRNRVLSESAQIRARREPPRPQQQKKSGEQTNADISTSEANRLKEELKRAEEAEARERTRREYAEERHRRSESSRSPETERLEEGLRKARESEARAKEAEARERDKRESSEAKFRNFRNQKPVQNSNEKIEFVLACRVLGLKSKPTPKEVKKARNQLSLKYHPDRIEKTPDAQRLSKERIQEINDAYDVLKKELRF